MLRADHPFMLIGWKRTSRDFGGMIAGWALIIYLWVFHYWGDYEMLDAQWVFDEIGHFLVAGFLGGLNILYVITHYTTDGDYKYFDHRWGVNATAILWVMFLGILWEFGELLLWDLWWQPRYYPLVAQANRGQLDALIDIALNPLGAWLATYAYPLLYFFNLKDTDVLLEQQAAKLGQGMEAFHHHVVELKGAGKKERRKRFRRHLVLRLKNLLRAMEELEDEPMVTIPLTSSTITYVYLTRGWTYIKPHIPNSLSILRLLLAIPIFILWPRYLWIIGLMLFGGFLDWLDGYLARKWGVTSTLGSMLDTVADKIFYLTMFWLLSPSLPWWIFPAAALLESALLIVRVLSLLGITRGEIPANPLGKIKFWTQCGVALGLLLGIILENRVLLQHSVELSMLAILLAIGSLVIHCMAAGKTAIV